MGEFLKNEILLDFIVKNQIYFVIFLTIVIMKFKEISKIDSYFAAFVYSIGTFFHELAHYLVAFFTTLKLPNNFSLFPKIEKRDGKKVVILGYVTINKNLVNIFNAFPIGMAPLLLLYLAYLVSKYFFVIYATIWEITVLSYLIYLFLITTLIVNSIPSKMDFIMAKTKGSLYLYILLLIVYLIYIFMGAKN